VRRRAQPFLLLRYIIQSSVPRSIIHRLRP
jgi:hypothetical protein